jgi:uncharacterized protein (DUF2267 family)
MDYERFIAVVQHGADVSREAAERAARATLETLAERISSGEARDVAVQLPPELAPWLANLNPAEAFDVDELVPRVAEREGTDEVTAEHHARPVFATLREALPGKELVDVTDQLPDDYAVLLARA